ncbi:lysophospholipid acyltransferase family protein [bacterium]|nr:lysophospholipid acyltransferase family protein [bacterium]
MNPFELNFTFQGKVKNWIWQLFRPSIKSVLGFNQLSKLYAAVPAGLSVDSFLETIIKVFKIKIDISEEDLARIPKSGPLVVISNHPFGGIEGAILGHVLRKVRPDTKFMATFILGKIPELRDFFILVDNFGSRQALKKNLKPLRESMDHLAQGGVLGVFPSGEVSHATWSNFEVVDPVWSNTIGRIVRKAHVPVLPIFVVGKNRLFFQIAGLIHKRLRTILLPRELLNTRNKTIKLLIGGIIPVQKLNSFESDQAVTDYLRLRSYILKGKLNHELKHKHTDTRTLSPVVDETPQHLQIHDLENLPEDQLLLANADHDVYFARAKQIPNILREIGRLREITFREVHEATGNSIDLSVHDEYYLHIFIWNRAGQEIVGAYRMGKTDSIRRHLGHKGLYTSTLFAYNDRLLDQIGPALEMGRSFIQQKYQRSYSPLLLLWQGIGRYVALNPRYKCLFGVVSINNDYDTLSRKFIVNFLKASNYLPEYAKLLKARNPMKVDNRKGLGTASVVTSIEDVDSIVEEIEHDGKRIPVLLRQYLKLGGKLLGFNVDPEFGNALDGLILVDLTKTDRKLLDRYLGKDGAQAFLSYHFQNHPTDKVETPKEEEIL